MRKLIQFNLNNISKRISTNNIDNSFKNLIYKRIIANKTIILNNKAQNQFVKTTIFNFSESGHQNTDNINLKQNEKEFLDASNMKNIINDSKSNTKDASNPKKLSENQTEHLKENEILDEEKHSNLKAQHSKSNENFDALLAATEEIKNLTADVPLEHKNYMKIVLKFIQESKEKALLEDSENDDAVDLKNKIILEDPEAFNFPRNLKPLEQVFGEENYKYFVYILENLRFFDIQVLHDFLCAFDFYSFSTQDILRLNALILDLFVKDNISPVPVCFIIVNYLGNKRNRKIANSDFYKKCIEIIKKESSLSLEKVGSLENFSNFLHSLSNFEIVDKKLNEILIDFYNNNSEALDDSILINYLRFSANIYYDNDLVENIFGRLQFTISKANFRSLLIIIKSLNNLNFKNQEFLDQVYFRFEEILEMNLNAQRKKIKIDENNKISPEDLIKAVNFLNNLLNLTFDKHLELEQLILNSINKEGIQTVFHLITLINMHLKLELKMKLKLNEAKNLKEKRRIKEKVEEFYQILIPILANRVEEINFDVACTLARIFTKTLLRLKSNIRNLCYLHCVLIENLFKPELIEKYNKTAINEFIKNSYIVFEKQTQREQIIMSYTKMNIKIDDLVKKKNGEDKDESESDDN